MECSGEIYPSRSNKPINDTAKVAEEYNCFLCLKFIHFHLLYFHVKLAMKHQKVLALAKLRILIASGALNA